MKNKNKYCQNYRLKVLVFSNFKMYPKIKKYFIKKSQNLSLEVEIDFPKKMYLKFCISQNTCFPRY